jgi:two-component system chemotaxis response regulator CheB
MVVDDSSAVREALSQIIASDPELEVIATASDPSSPPTSSAASSRT